tara:strand:+ start:65 stop:244 length:180 start_codon:yes stop_codon:yes gene_type:complete
MENLNNQGKRPEQYTDSAKFAWYGVVGMVIILLLVMLLGGCAITNETPKKPCCKTEKKC